MRTLPLVLFTEESPFKLAVFLLVRMLIPETIISLAMYSRSVIMVLLPCSLTSAVLLPSKFPWPPWPLSLCNIASGAACSHGAVADSMDGPQARMLDGSSIPCMPLNGTPSAADCRAASNVSHLAVQATRATRAVASLTLSLAATNAANWSDFAPGCPSSNHAPGDSKVLSSPAMLLWGLQASTVGVARSSFTTITTYCVKRLMTTLVIKWCPAHPEGAGHEEWRFAQQTIRRASLSGNDIGPNAAEGQR